MKALTRLTGVVIACIAPLFAFAQAEKYPEQIVKIVVPYPAGGYFDRVARIVGEALQSSLKQNFIVENRVGASGMIGAEFVARSKPDGYTLLLGGQTQNVIAPLIRASTARYDPIRDFSPIASLVDAPSVLVVNRESKAQSFQELLALLKAMKGRATYASAGTGAGGSHLGMELLKSAFDLEIQHIPFKGSAPAVAALAGAQVDVSIATILDILPLIRAGRVRAIAVTGTQRLGPLAGIPTIAEATGRQGLESSTWSALLAPAGTSQSVVRSLNVEVNRALADPAVVKRLSPGGELAIVGGSPEQLAALIRAELEKWGKVIREKNITPE